MGKLALPADQIVGMGLAEAERKIDLVDAGRAEFPAVLRVTRLVHDEVAFDGPPAPQHDGAAALVDDFADHLPVAVAGQKVEIPPDVEAELLERMREALREL